MLSYRDIYFLLSRRLSRRKFMGLLSAFGLARFWPGETPAMKAAVSSEHVNRCTALPKCRAPAMNAISSVIVAHNPQVTHYPASPPFDPGAPYPEYPYEGDELAASGENGAYALVREALRLMNPQGFGAGDWNPLGAVIGPGDTVLIKPNWVEDNGWERGKITPPAVLRPIIDYIYKACGPEGRILLAEGPYAVGVFERVIEVTGTRHMVEHLAGGHGIPLVLQDLNQGTRETTILVDLGAASEFHGVERKWQDGHYNEMSPDRVGRYRIAPAILEADVIVNVPKVKVHCMAGVTLAMKNMLGIIPSWDGPYEDLAQKDCPHTSDFDLRTGDQGKFLDNDTIWRSIADLNRLVLYADRQGRLQPQPQRRYLAIVDGIVAGEASQFQPHPYPLSTIVVGREPLTVDAVTTRLMGFDPRRVRSVYRAAERQDLPLGPIDPARIEVIINGDLSTIYRRSLTPETQVYSWQGHLEADDFDPPEILEQTRDARSGSLTVRARDRCGVACVRASYTIEGREYVQDLALTDGDEMEGQWSGQLPPGANEARITVCDALFNAAQVPGT